MPMIPAGMNVIATILARAGSRGLPHKAILMLRGQPVIGYTIDHALEAEQVNAVVVSSDSEVILSYARARHVEAVARPPELATDTARVDQAAWHALRAYEDSFDYRADAVVILYGNVPVRRAGVIDEAVSLLLRGGADSVRTVTPVGKQHPQWLWRVEGERLVPYGRPGTHRRQDLEPLYYHDGAVVVVRRECLERGVEDPDPHAFFGRAWSAVVQRPEDTVEIDTLADYYTALGLLCSRSLGPPPVASVAVACPRRRLLTGAVTVGRHARR